MSHDESPTRTSDAPRAEPRPAAETHFAAGSILAGRYRIVALLGRGGMGEVYRADDLRLGQTVAIKLLPAALAQDPGRLARFVNEVRVARQVTHPNVCRVHDLGEAEGLHFLSMEYVDGEDLSSLLRRIGRLPKEKATELGRQVCAGLAAAHERGVLHRDLKPANVMIDGRGRARLTDFGLAVAAGESGQGEDLAGTPAYMAPEQFEGRAATERSDVYALGLVLYELYSGRRAFEAPTFKEVARLHREAVPPAPSELVPDLDPAVEAVILRCLEKDPARRPASALAVAAALTGGDALAAAVAAGLTPAPEMVAAAGETGVMRPAAAAGVLLFVLAGLPLALALVDGSYLLKQVPLEMPPEVLSHRAREAASRLGAPPGRHVAWGFEYDRPLVAQALRLRGPTPPGVIRFWHRTSAEPLSAAAPGGVDPDDPPLTTPRMTLLRLDTAGRLLELQSVPASDDRPAPEPDWGAALKDAGLEPGRMREIPPTFVPSVFADRRLAWETADPAAEARPSVEAASHGGRVVLFRVRTPTTPARGEHAGARQVQLGEQIFSVVFFLSLAAAGLLAWRNLRLGRGDRRGALRLAVFAFVVRLGAWALAADHTADLVRERDLFVWALGRSAYAAGLFVLLYLAIEPAVRRRWPDALVSWSRLLAGRIRDPLVGRDVLMGLACAVAMMLVWLLGRNAPLLWGQTPAPLVSDLDLLGGGLRPFLAYLLMSSINAILGCLLFAVTFLVLRRVVRSAVPAAVAVATIVTASLGLAGGQPPTEVLGMMLPMVLLLVLMARYGFLAVAVTSFALGAGRMRVPPTIDLGAWYGASTLAWVLVLCGLAAAGCYLALGGRAPFRLSLED